MLLNFRANFGLTQGKKTGQICSLFWFGGPSWFLWNPDKVPAETVFLYVAWMVLCFWQKFFCFGTAWFNEEKNSLNKKLEGVRNSNKHIVGTFWYLGSLSHGAMSSYLKLMVCHCNSVETGEKKSGMKRHIPSLHTLFSILTKRERSDSKEEWLVVSIIHRKYVCTPKI